MIWLASFPRSGNTFLRNILFEVYGLASSTYHRESDRPLDENFQSYPFVKTHELPATLAAAGFPRSLPAVCLVRDGRDALCSIAHHRSDLIKPGSDYLENLRAAIIAERGSHFGGWSANVDAWLERADLVIRYEDLVARPVEQVERLRNLMRLPVAATEKLPTFAVLKAGTPEYGSRRHQPVSEASKREHASLFFRRGQAGAWKDEMPEALQALFWSFHGETMHRLGYTQQGEVREPHRDLDGPLRLKLGLQRQGVRKPYRVLVEADKLVSDDNDGIKRYQVELLRAMYPVVNSPEPRWEIDLLCHGQAAPLRSFRHLLFAEFRAANMRAGAGGPVHTDAAAEAPADPAVGPARLSLAPETLDADPPASQACESLPRANIFLRFERWLVARVPRSWVQYLHRRQITLFHDVYDFCRGILEWIGDQALELAAFLRSHVPRIRLRASQEPANDYKLVHIPLLQNFQAASRFAGRTLVTVHDLTHLLFPQLHTAINARNAQAGLEFLESSGATALCISESTRADLLQHSSVPAARTHVVLEAANPRIFHRKTNQDDCRAVRRKYGLEFDDPYIICLSTLEPRKNLENTIRAYIGLIEADPALQLRLVIAGKQGWDTEGVYDFGRQHSGKIAFTGFVDDADLAYLYSDALFLSYLSLYEGFGLPPLEAMRCGTPVVYGNNSSMLEVVADGGLPADPHDLADIRRQYLRMIQDPQLRETLALTALRRAGNFSWRRAAEETLALYERLIDA